MVVAHPPNRPEGVYDWGGPDYPEDTEAVRAVDPDYEHGAKANLKHGIICKAVRSFAEKEGVPLEELVLWIDWQGIAQDDLDEKSKGVQSLIAYTTLCDYMLVPTEEGEFAGDALTYPEDVPGYGKRGWCRSEFFVFSSWAEMEEVTEVQLYAATREGALQHYPVVKIIGAEFMPSGGDFTVEADRVTVRGIEDQMIVEYGKKLIQLKCKAAGAEQADLSGKMVRAVHVPTLGDEVRRHGIVSINLSDNQLGAEGGAALLAKTLDAMPSLATLECVAPTHLHPVCQQPLTPHLWHAHPRLPHQLQ